MKLIAYFVLSFFLLISTQGFSFERKKILVLHSYHQGLQWTDNVSQGIREVMDSIGDGYELDYEYLDTKQNTSIEYLNKLVELYELKLKKEK